MYTKLFASILDSSVWLEPHATRIVWLTLLAAKDAEGFARFASIENLARRAVVTEDEAKAAVAKLEAPDLNSSNPDHEGRRIERVPGGWVVLNAELYDEMVRQEDERRATRERVRRHRERSAGKEPGKPSPRKPGGLAPYDQVFEEAWAAYPKRPNNTKTSAWRQWCARVGDGVDPLDMLEGTRRYARFCEHEGTEPRFVKMAQTFYGRDKHFLNDFTIAPAKDEPEVHARQYVDAIRKLITVKGQSRFIPRMQVEMMGQKIVKAYDMVGGAEKFLAVTAEKLPFLVREFDQALRAA